MLCDTGAGGLGGAGRGRRAAGGGRSPSIYYIYILYILYSIYRCAIPAQVAFEVLDEDDVLREEAAAIEVPPLPAGRRAPLIPARGAETL